MTNDGRCRECGHHLQDKNARDVGYCLDCYNRMMCDGDADGTIMKRSTTAEKCYDPPPHRIPT